MQCSFPKRNFGAALFCRGFPDGHEAGRGLEVGGGGLRQGVGGPAPLGVEAARHFRLVGGKDAEKGGAVEYPGRVLVQLLR